MTTVVILHGWSDDAASFQPLRDFIAKLPGRDVRTIHLGDYISLEDGITIEDLAKAFDRALRDKQVIPGLAPGEEVPDAARFDLVVHSTGALVAREWLTRYFLERGKARCPVQRLLMLAPANFGSPLAHLGKTMFGRVVKGWTSDFQVGAKILDALELGSTWTWELAERDLFGDATYYVPERCCVAVLVGTRPYTDLLRKLVSNPGSDGTVYVATANLNATRVEIDLRRRGEQPAFELKKPKEPIAFAAFEDRDHKSIILPGQGEQDLGMFIAQFLDVTPASYPAFRTACAGRTVHAIPPGADPDALSPNRHAYQNVVCHVRDDFDYDVSDFFLEFYDPSTPPDRDDPLMTAIHTQVLEQVHIYQRDRSYRSLLFDVTDLRSRPGADNLHMSVSAAPSDRLIHYSAGATNDVGEYKVPPTDAFWRPNETLLLSLRIVRVQDDTLFEWGPRPPKDG